MGQFSPGGDSPYGLQDAAGNVWEWTASTSEPSDESRRVLRGGAFLSDRDIARCAFRYWYSPLVGWYDFGFRIVVSPISPASAL